MTFDQAKAIVQLMGYQVHDYTDRVDRQDTSFYVDVWSPDEERLIFDCCIYGIPETARTRFVQWVDEFNAVPAKDTSDGFVSKA